MASHPTELLATKTGLERPLPVWRVGALVIAGPVLFTLLFWLLLPNNLRINESTDYTGFYRPVAHSLLARRGFVLEDGSPATRYPPGYPVLLAGVFGMADLLHVSEGAALSTLALAGMASVSALLFAITQSVAGPRAALVASLLWATYPFSLWLTKQPNSEIPFAVLLYAAFYFFWRGLNQDRLFPAVWLAVGFLAGLTMLVRPIGIGLGLVMAGCILLLGRGMSVAARRASVLLLLAGNLLAVLPWQVWVYRHTGKAAPLSTGGAPSVRDGLTFAVGPKSGRESVTVPDDVRTVMQTLRGRYDDMKTLGGVVRVVTEEFSRQPLAVGKLFLIKAVRSWYATDSGRWEIPALAVQIPYLVLVLWATKASLSGGDAIRRLTFAVWLVVLYFWAMTMMVLSILRYMTPAMGLLFVLAGQAGARRLEARRA